MPKYINKFKTAVYHQETILDEHGDTIGHLRIKPSGILWKPTGESEFYSVQLDKFTEWITASHTKAGRAKQ